METKWVTGVRHEQTVRELVQRLTIRVRGKLNIDQRIPARDSLPARAQIFLGVVRSKNTSGKRRRKIKRERESGWQWRRRERKTPEPFYFSLLSAPASTSKQRFCFVRRRIRKWSDCCFQSGVGRKRRYSAALEALSFGWILCLFHETVRCLQTYYDPQPFYFLTLFWKIAPKKNKLQL